MQTKVYVDYLLHRREITATLPFLAVVWLIVSNPEKGEELNQHVVIYDKRCNR